MHSYVQKTVNLSPFFAHISYKKESVYEIYDITVSSETKQKVYVSLTGESDADFYSFNGLCKKERIFRQSPHDPLQCHFTMEKSAVPMVAAVKDGKADIFISDKIQKGIIKNA